MAGGRPVVCVQGLGWAGTATTAAIATAQDGDGKPAFTAIGVELPTSEGRAKVEELNAGRVPMRAVDGIVRSRASTRVEPRMQPTRANPVTHRSGTRQIRRSSNAHGQSSPRYLYQRTLSPCGLPVGRPRVHGVCLGLVWIAYLILQCLQTRVVSGIPP